jgi:hypothetical protein
MFKMRPLCSIGWQQIIHATYAIDFFRLLHFDGAILICHFFIIVLFQLDEDLVA